MGKHSSVLHHEIKPYTIFAIIVNDDGDNLAYVGKTTSQNLNPVLRRHLRGEVSLTKNDFSIDVTNNKPIIIPLERILCTGSDAYRHTLCWNKILDDHGYITITYKTTDWQAYNMVEKTKSIYDKIISTLPIDDILKGLQHPISPVIENTSYNHTTEKEPCVQLNIRVNPHDKDLFYRMCHKNNMTQQQGFSHMLLSTSLSNEEDRSLIKNRIFNELESSLSEKDNKIRELKKRLSGISRGQVADQKLKAALKNANHLIKEYVHLNFPSPMGPTLKCLSFKMWKRTQNHDLPYIYPATAGHSIVILDSICYGKGTVPAIFVHARDITSNERLKFRYYPSTYFVGISPKNIYELPESVWLIGYAPATDGAMALNFALPLFVELHNESYRENNELPSLDDIINEINQYNY